MKIVFILPNLSQARYYKRIKCLKDLGAKTNVFAFERKYYKGKFLKSEYIPLGAIMHGNYLNRLIPLLKAIFIIKNTGMKSNVIYTFGMDMLLLGLIVRSIVAGRYKLVYEVGDIRSIMLYNGILSSFTRLIERILLRFTDTIVVTSQAFIEQYYKKIQKNRALNYHVIENKLQYKFGCMKNTCSYAKKKIGRITIGYFGLIRCRNSLEILKSIAQKGQGKFAINLRGLFFGENENALNEIKTIEHIVYGGEYISPDDLPELYENIDIVWACYPYQGRKAGNWMWARTNRFYEACFFKKPMVTQKNTEDDRVVSSLKLGYSLNLEDINSAVEEILDITFHDIEKWKYNIQNLPEDIYLYSDEHERLLSALNL